MGTTGLQRKHMELERTPHDNTIRLSVIDEGAAKRLWARRILDTYQLIALKNESHHLVYLDTPQHTLAHVQVSIAIHVHNQGKQTITYTGGDTTVTAPLTSGQWPAEIRTALAQLDVAAHTLVPTIQIMTKAQMRRLYHPTAGDMAELVLNHGTIYANGMHEPFCEIVLTACAQTSVAQLQEIANHVQQHVPSMIQTTSKHARGERLAQQVRGTPDRDTALRQHIAMLQGTQRNGDESLFVALPHYDSMHHRIICASVCQLRTDDARETEPFWLALDAASQHEVTTLASQCEAPAYAIHGAALSLTQQLFSEGLRLQLRGQFRRMLVRRAHVLNTFDADYVHRMRVILRKIRALLECADGIYADDVLSQYKRGFRRMARFLGEVRDCDVLVDNIQRICGDTAAAPEVMRAIANTRAHALSALHELFTSTKHRHFIHEFAVFVCTPHAAAIAGTQTIRSGDMLATRIAERAAEFQKPLATTIERVDDEVLHAWRIRGKRLRYILECFPSVIVPDTTPALHILDTTQQHLGVLQDAVVAFELFGKIKMHTHPDSKKVVAQLRQEAHQYRQQLPALWQQCTGAAFNDAISATISAIR